MKDKTLYLAIKQAFKTVARPLEQALWRRAFEDGSHEDVLAELLKFQNEDGGFGHGLEPDYTNPASSPIQTWAATTILRSLGLGRHHPVIEKTASYLASSFDPVTRRWPFTVPSNNDHPHAPWWHHDEDDLVNFNPSAALAGFLVRHTADLRARDCANLVLADALEFLVHEQQPIESHELRCFIRLIDDLTALDLDHPFYHEMRERITSEMMKAVCRDPGVWFKDYVTKPSDLVQHPDDLLGAELKPLVIEEIKTSLQARGADALWPVTWSWHAFPEAFEKAKRHWQGIIALHYVSLMHHFDW